MLPKKLSAQINKNHPWAVNTLKKYLSIPSVSAQKRGTRESVRFLTGILRQCGLKVRVIKTKSGHPPVIYAEKTVNPRAKTILFYNHYDVQPAEPLELWTTPPFKAAIRDGKIFGRGASDNKGNLITRLNAIKSFHDAGLELPVNVKFVLEGEEEVGSRSLPLFMKKYRKMIAADMCIWELGFHDENGRPKLSLGCKGIIHTELTTRTTRTDLHSSLGIIVPNPAWRLAWALNSLKGADERIRIKGFYQHVRRLDRLDRKVVRQISFDEKKKLGELGLKKFVLGLKGKALIQRFYYQPALNINGLIGGYQGKGNKTVLPKEAAIKIDFRLVPNQNPTDILKKLRRHLDREGFKDIGIKDATGYPPARTPLNNQYVKLVAEAQTKIYGKRAMIEPLFAASGPMYLFTPLMPCFCEGVGHPASNIHAPDENIYLKDFLLGAKCIAEIMNKLGGSKI